MVRTLSFHCRKHGFNPHQEIKIPHATAQPKKERKAAHVFVDIPIVLNLEKTVLKTGTNGLPKLIPVSSGHEEELAYPGEGWGR